MDNFYKSYGVIGWPLHQSLSPLIHNAGFKEIDFPGIYFAWSFPPDDLEIFVKAMRFLPISGVSVTIPYKLVIKPFLDKIETEAEKTGAINTIYWECNKLIGQNTDLMGFLHPLKKYRNLIKNALLLGAGGAAHAVCAGLQILGIKDVYIASPGNKSQFILAEKFGYLPIFWEQRNEINANLIINSTPLGMVGENLEKTPYSSFSSDVQGIAYDIVYNPEQTIFLEKAREAGWKTITGLEMFFWQADAQFKIWTDQNLPASCYRMLQNFFVRKR